MIKVNVHDKDAQQVVMKTLYPESGVKMRIEGELELYDITEALVVELFKNLLHKNLVQKLLFYTRKKRIVKKKLGMFKRVESMKHIQRMFMAFWQKTEAGHFQSKRFLIKQELRIPQ